MKTFWIVASLGLAAPLARAQNTPAIAISASEAAILAPRAGEILLEGEIVKTSADGQNLEILARAFSTPSNRRELETPRAKTLVINAQTQLLGAKRPLQTLPPQTLVRVVGREIAEQPFVARALLWGDAAQPATTAPAATHSAVPVAGDATIEGDATVPDAVAQILPAPRQIAGASVRLVDAGFRLDKRIPLAPVFYFVVRATPGAKVSLLNIVGPDLQLATYSAVPTQTGDGHAAENWIAPYVDARWDHVRVFMEVTAPDAPADARGSFVQNFPVELPLPALGQTIPLHKTIATPHGSTVEISEISNNKPQKDGNGDRLSNADGTLSIEIRSQKPGDAPDAKIGLWLKDYQVENKDWYPNSSGSEGSADKTTLHLSRPPAAIKTMTANLEVSESAPQWVMPQYFGVATFELPVAALLKARPPATPADAPQLFEAQTPGGVARISAPQWIDGAWQMRLWTQRHDVAGLPESNPNVATRLVVTEVVAKSARGHEFSWSNGGHSGDLFLTPDNTPLARDEAAHRVIFREATELDAPVQLTATAQERRFYSSMHDFRGLPIPPRGQTLELGEKWSDESAQLARIGWTKGGQLVVICENISLWNGSFSASPAATTKGATGGAADSAQALKLTSQGTYDPLGGAGLKPGALALTFEAPLPGAQTLDLIYGVTEIASDSKRTFHWDLSKNAN